MHFNSDFKYDLKLGQLGEKHLSRILKDKKIEVKTDFQAEKTGNIFVEYSSRNKPSGISISESDWYAFIISNEKIKLIATKKLKEICRKYLNTKRDIKGGDNNTSSGVLVPLEKI